METLKRQLTTLRITIFILIIIIVGIGLYSLSNNSDNEPLLPDLATFTVRTTDVERIVGADGNVESTESQRFLLPAGVKIIDLDKDLNDRVEDNEQILTFEETSLTGTSLVNVGAGIEGVITQMSISEGSFYQGGQPALTIVNDDRLQVTSLINENDIANLRPDQSVEVLFPAINLDETYPGKVKSIAAEPAVQSGAVDYLVEVQLNEKPNNLKLGMSAELEILTAVEEDVLAIPENYLIERDDEYFVKEVVWNEDRTNYTTNEVEVFIGLETDRLVEIVDGINENTILLDPAYQQQRSVTLFDSF